MRDTFSSIYHPIQIALKLLLKPPSLDCAFSFDKTDIQISPDQTKPLCDVRFRYFAVASVFPEREKNRRSRLFQQEQT